MKIVKTYFRLALFLGPPEKWNIFWAPKNEFWEKIEFSSLALTANALVTYLLKFGIGRERPNGGDNFSFPSGHTSHSFTIAAVTNELYGKKIGTLAYCMATLSAISRVHDNMHYLSDIIIGAGIGTIIGRGFSIQYKKRTKKHVYLLPSKKGVTLAVIFWPIFLFISQYFFRILFLMRALICCHSTN